MLKLAISRLAKGSFVYGIGSVLQRVMGLLMLPFFTQVLTTKDYGVLALVSLISIAISGLLTLGTGSSIGVLYFREKDPSKQQAIIWSNVVLMAVNGLLWLTLLCLYAPLLSQIIFQTEQYADLIRLGVLGSVFVAITEPWLSYLRMEEKAKKYVLLTTAGALLTIVFSTWFVMVERVGVIGLILGTTLSHGMMLLISWLIVGRRLHFKLEFKFIRQLVQVGFPSIFGLFAFLIIDYADRQMIETLMNLEWLGVYSIGYSFGMVMSVATGAFATAWPAFFSSYIDKTDEARVIFGRVLTYYLIVFGGLVVLFFAIARPLVSIMTAETFHDAYLVLGLIAASHMFKGCYLILLPGIYFAKKIYKQSAIEWVAAIINIGLNLWLIPIYGIAGAAIATFISYLYLPIGAWLVSRRYLIVDYEWQRILRIAILLCISCSLIMYSTVNMWQSLILMAIANLLIALCFFTGVYRLSLKSSERNAIWKNISK